MYGYDHFYYLCLGSDFMMECILSKEYLQSESHPRQLWYERFIWQCMMWVNEYTVSDSLDPFISIVIPTRILDYKKNFVPYNDGHTAGLIYSWLLVFSYFIRWWIVHVGSVAAQFPLIWIFRIGVVYSTIWWSIKNKLLACSRHFFVF